METTDLSECFKALVGALLFILPTMAIAGALLYFGMRYLAQRRIIYDLPISKTAGVFIGLASLEGTAESDAPFESHLAKVPCVYYSWSIKEQWKRIEEVTTTNEKGETKTEKKEITGWSTVSSGFSDAPFYLKDDQGAIRIIPHGANIDAEVVFWTECSPTHPMYYKYGSYRSIPDSNHRRELSEEVIRLHAPLYVIGQARIRSDIVAAEIAKSPDSPIFQISTFSRDRVGLRVGAEGVSLCFAGCVVAALGGFFVQSAIQRIIPIPGLWVLAILAYFAAAFVAWLWMIYNSLINLLQRVRQAGAQIESELKRRHDLIPNLVAVVAAMRSHEASLLKKLAFLRSQAQVVSQFGTETAHGCAAVLNVIIEAYPELKSHRTFQNLHSELTKTEQRIALARDYFNEIATSYNTRIETIPEQFVAELGRLHPFPLFEAKDFERAAITVDFK
jgi:hypothetical protein